MDIHKCYVVNINDNAKRQSVLYMYQIKNFTLSVWVPWLFSVQNYCYLLRFSCTRNVHRESWVFSTYPVGKGPQIDNPKQSPPTPNFLNSITIGRNVFDFICTKVVNGKSSDKNQGHIACQPLIISRWKVISCPIDYTNFQFAHPAFGSSDYTLTHGWVSVHLWNRLL